MQEVLCAEIRKQFTTWNKINRDCSVEQELAGIIYCNIIVYYLHHECCVAVVANKLYSHDV